MKKEILETERLILNKHTMSDAPKVAELAGHKKIYETTLAIPHPYSEEQAVEWIKKLQSPETKIHEFAIRLKETGELIGGIGLMPTDSHPRAELGYWMGVPFWGQGFCTEAATRMLEYGFTEMERHRIMATHDIDNPASGAVMKKIGMTYEGTLRDHYYKDGKYRTNAVYSILKDEYFA